MSTHTHKAVQIRLSDDAGTIYKWTIRRVPRTYLVNPEGPLSRSRIGTGWEYQDHDGYCRFQEGNWLDVLPRVRLTASNYGLNIETELS